MRSTSILYACYEQTKEQLGLQYGRVGGLGPSCRYSAYSARVGKQRLRQSPVQSGTRPNRPRFHKLLPSVTHTHTIGYTLEVAASFSGLGFLIYAHFRVRTTSCTALCFPLSLPSRDVLTAIRTTSHYSTTDPHDCIWHKLRGTHVVPSSLYRCLSLGWRWNHCILPDIAQFINFGLMAYHCSRHFYGARI